MEYLADDLGNINIPAMERRLIWLELVIRTGEFINFDPFRRIKEQKVGCEQWKSLIRNLSPEKKNNPWIYGGKNYVGT